MGKSTRKQKSDHESESGSEPENYVVEKVINRRERNGKVTFLF